MAACRRTAGSIWTVKYLELASSSVFSPNGGGEVVAHSEGLVSEVSGPRFWWLRWGLLVVVQVGVGAALALDIATRTGSVPYRPPLLLAAAHVFTTLVVVVCVLINIRGLWRKHSDLSRPIWTLILLFGGSVGLLAFRWAQREELTSPSP